MKSIRLKLAVTVFIAFASAFSFSCATDPTSSKQWIPVPGGHGNVVSLSQGWSQQEQQRFWFTSQGSQLIPYDWFLVLEQPDRTNYFRDDDNMERMGWLPSKRSSYNPDGLPIGFVRDTTAFSRKSWMGFTCAACHTGQINYHGTHLRIDGGPTMADAHSFLLDLDQALHQTQDDPTKFARFAHNIPGQRCDQAGLNVLSNDLYQIISYVDGRTKRNTTLYPYGYGRLDAFGNILNEILANDLNLPQNVRPPDAPVSFPFLWNTSQADYVQWNGSACNSAIGPLTRNIGEALGVFAKVDMEPNDFLHGYRSTVKVYNLTKLEGLSAKLWSPQWPSQYLPPIDRAKAKRGAVHYDRYCASCHEVINRTDTHRLLHSQMIPIDEVRTDPTMASNFVARTGSTGRLAGTKSDIISGDKFGPVSGGEPILDNAVAGVVLDHPLFVVIGKIESLLGRPSLPRHTLLAYKARPLNGIWATAPYLHNGSVPNLWELLKPAKDRIKEFYVGSYEFDPVQVGYESQPSKVAFQFDTRLPGNANTGHDGQAYGTEVLTDEQKWELVEYLKSL